MIIIYWNLSLSLSLSRLYFNYILRNITFYTRHFLNTQSILCRDCFSFLPTMTENMLVCFLCLPLPLGRANTEEIARTSQLTAVASHYYILVKAMHRERFQATSKLKIWPRLISARRQNGALLRDRFRLCDSKARLSAIKSSRPAPTEGSQSARFPIQLVRAGRVGIILALCASKMPVGDTSRPSKHPMNQP